MNKHEHQVLLEEEKTCKKLKEKPAHQKMEKGFEDFVSCPFESEGLQPVSTKVFQVAIFTRHFFSDGNVHLWGEGAHICTAQGAENAVMSQQLEQI